MCKYYAHFFTTRAQCVLHVVHFVYKTKNVPLAISSSVSALLMNGICGYFRPDDDDVRRACIYD